MLNCDARISKCNAIHERLASSTNRDSIGQCYDASVSNFNTTANKIKPWFSFGQELVKTWSRLGQGSVERKQG